MDRNSTRCENVNMAPVKKQLGPLGPTFLKEWREHVGLDQETAASRLNVSRTLLSKIEGQKSPYTQRLLEAAAGVYGCSPADLISRPPEQGPRSPETQLRSALLAFGVDVEDLGRAVSAVKVFVDDHDEQSEEDLPDGRSEPSTRRRVKVPSE
jgi:transcriptional regulator with XRE-family HTH domain